MKKTIANLLVTLLGLALLVYSATRSLDFIATTLPPDKQILAWFGLAALDGGLLFWLLNFLHGAAGAWQRGTALLMIVVDFIGCVAMFTLDTLLRTGESGMTAALAPSEIQAAVLALSGVIALNIAATILYHVTDPDARKRMAAEEAQDLIEDAVVSKISSSAQSLAAELAPTLADDWMASTRARYLANIGRPTLPAQTVDTTARDVTAQRPAEWNSQARHAPQEGEQAAHNSQGKPAALSDLRMWRMRRPAPDLAPAGSNGNHGTNHNGNHSPGAGDDDFLAGGAQ